MAESEVRAGLGLGPGPPAAAPGPSALALRAQLPCHGEGPAAVEPVAGQEQSERREGQATVQVALANETEWRWRRRRGGQAGQEPEFEQKEERGAEGTFPTPCIFLSFFVWEMYNYSISVHHGFSGMIFSGAKRTGPGRMAKLENSQMVK